MGIGPCLAVLAGWGGAGVAVAGVGFFATFVVDVAAFFESGLAGFAGELGFAGSGGDAACAAWVPWLPSFPGFGALGGANRTPHCEATSFA